MKSKPVSSTPEWIKAYYAEYYKDPVKLAARRLADRKSYLKHRNKRIAKSRNWNVKNEARYKANKNSNSSARRKTDPEFKLSAALRVRLNNAVKRNSKGGSAVKLLSCTIKELKIYLEAKFQPGMTWDNWSLYGWHIDHIIPLSSFDLSDHTEIAKACHFTNLQPLWAKDNMSKGAKCA